MEWIIEHIVPVLFVIFYIFLQTTKLKQRSSEQNKKATREENFEVPNAKQVQEEIRRMIRERKEIDDKEAQLASSESLEEQDRYPIRKNTLDKASIPLPAQAHRNLESETRVKEISQKISGLYVDYERQLKEQRKKIEEARVLRKKAIHEEEQIYHIHSGDSLHQTLGSSQRALSRVLLSRSSLAQAMLAKEILGKPKGFKGF